MKVLWYNIYGENMRLTIKEIMIIIDTLQNSLEITEENKNNFRFSNDDRKKVLIHLNSLANNTCITLEGDTGNKR